MVISIYLLMAALSEYQAFRNSLVFWDLAQNLPIKTAAESIHVVSLRSFHCVL